MVLAETPPVSPNASIRTRTSPFIDSTLRPFPIPTHKFAVPRERIFGGDRAFHRFPLYFRVELRWKLGGQRAVDGAGGNPAGVTERFHTDAHVAIHRLDLDRAFRRRDIHIAAHRVDHQGAPRPRHVHVPHHGRRAQARTARQPDCEVYSHVVVASASHFDVAVSRRATTVAIPHGADGNAAVVGHGDETYARRVRRPVRLHG